MLHPRQCSCFDCKNGYTPDKDRADLLLRKWKKPTGKRLNRTKKIKNIKNAFTKQERKEFGEQMRFFKSI